MRHRARCAALTPPRRTSPRRRSCRRSRRLRPVRPRAQLYAVARRDRRQPRDRLATRPDCTSASEPGPPDTAAAMEPPPGTYSEEVLTGIGRALPRASRRGRDALRARVHARRDRPSAWTCRAARSTRGLLQGPGRAGVATREGGARMNPQRALSSFRAPEEAATQERTWTVVRDAYRMREPVRRRRSRGRLLLRARGRDRPRRGDAVAGRRDRGAVDPPRARGPARRAGACSELPAPGSLLVSGSGGTWTVAADGSAGRLGPWRRRAGPRTGCSWRSHEAISWRHRDLHRDTSLDARATGRSRPPLVCPDRLCA